jgi:uncharacterized protein (DUF39 family)
MAKTYAEINEKIRRGEAVVVTAEEMIGVVKERGAKEAAKKVDVVTTGTFGAMCSSGAFINIGHAKPRIKIGGGRVTLNDVSAYAGLAAVDIYVGATALQEEDPRNQVFPGEFRYGGGHVIEDASRLPPMAPTATRASAWRRGLTWPISTRRSCSTRATATRTIMWP